MGELLVILVVLVICVIVFGPIVGGAVAALTTVTCKISMDCTK